MGTQKLSREFWKRWLIQHEKAVSFIVFVGGFIFDNFTLWRIDSILDMSILFGWLLVGSFAIFSMNISRHGILKWKIFRKGDVWLHFLISFALGALFSGFTIFYMRSAVLSTSWPFLLIVVGLFLGNEFFKEKYLHLNFQIVILFTVVFFQMILFVPIFVGKMGDWVFLLSGAVSLVMIGAFVHFLYFFLPKEAQVNQRKLILSIGSVFLAINFFYFTNLIPPVPLALKDGGVFHYMERTTGGKYFFQDEQRHWYDAFDFYENVHVVQGESLFFYSAVFAPTRLDTDIMHNWQYYDESSGKWVVSANIRFPIYGGSNEGYRGFSEKSNIHPGKWRVDVTDSRGRVLGRTKFEIINVGEAVPLVSVVK
ncbi:MAG: DUF2914 domain-containing protein [Candidatus Parcubacteria bacterium]|nr:DUF2914 domain-containing protein [Candidatus Parcubacteria bacterium]